MCRWTGAGWESRQRWHGVVDKRRIRRRTTDTTDNCALPPATATGSDVVGHVTRSRRRCLATRSHTSRPRGFVSERLNVVVFSACNNTTQRYISNIQQV